MDYVANPDEIYPSLPAEGRQSDILRLAVQNSTYYSEIKHMQFAELVNEITKHVTPSLEPWVKGAHGVPSSLSCIVYRL